MVMILSLFSLALLAVPAISSVIPIPFVFLANSTTNQSLSQERTLHVKAVALTNLTGPVDKFSAIITLPLSLNKHERGERREIIKLNSDDESLEVGFDIDADGEFTGYCKLDTPINTIFVPLLNDSITGSKTSVHQFRSATVLILVSFFTIGNESRMRVSLRLMAIPYNVTTGDSSTPHGVIFLKWESTKAIKNQNIQLRASSVIRGFLIDQNVTEQVQVSSYDLKYISEGEVIVPMQWEFSGSIDPPLPVNVTLPLSGKFQKQSFSGFLENISY